MDVISATHNLLNLQIDDPLPKGWRKLKSGMQRFFRYVVPSDNVAVEFIGEGGRLWW